MLDREIKIKNTIIGRFMALFVAGVVCLSQAIPVFADDESKTLYTFGENNSLQFFIESPFYYTSDSTSEIVIPLYLTFFSGHGNTYYSGYVSGTITPFNIVDGNSNRWVISYFESTRTDINVVYARNTGTVSIYFDNAMMRGSIRECVGYLHVMGNYSTDSITLTCSNNVQYMSITASQLYYTSYEWGYVNAMIYALNNSANVEDMLSILNSIDANMLPEILTVMRSNHTALYNLIQNVWTTDQAVLSVDRNIYNTVLSILGILEDAYAPQASQAEDIKDDVEQDLSNLISDIELTKPSQVANIADDYIAQIDTSYNNLAFGFLSNNTIVLMLCIVAGLAIISYMLYGGQ